MTVPLDAEELDVLDRVLTKDQTDAISRLTGKMRRERRRLDRLDAYYEAEQRLEHIGLAVPPELRRFETVINVPRMAVDEPERRQELRAFYRNGNSVKEDPVLREAWDANNMESESSLVHIDEKIFGHCLVSVGTNNDDPDHPLIAVESPIGIAVELDAMKRNIVVALRVYRDTETRDTFATLYEKNRTTYLHKDRNGWSVVNVDKHNLKRVPLVMFSNRRRGSRAEGVSEMADVIGMTDAIARMITIMAIGAEAHGLPAQWAVGVSQGDFIDKVTKKPLTTWETYFTAIKATSNPEARFGNFTPSDLRNFHDSVNNMLAWCAAQLGLPTRYAGQQSVNPAAEGAIRADEARLVQNVQRKNVHDGACWAWVMGLYERIRTGDWPDNNSIRARWFDPGTATYSQRADALVKQRQVGAISIEGMWDELGWDEARKRQEKNRLQAEKQAELNDPVMLALSKNLLAADTQPPQQQPPEQQPPSGQQPPPPAKPAPPRNGQVARRGATA